MSGDALAGIRTQLLWDRLIAVVEEQAQTLIRTAFSNTVREAGDLSAGVFDLQGRMLAQAVTGTPGHVNAMAASVGHFLEKYDLDGMHPGDAYITNDPWLATGHLHDFTVVSPTFRGTELVALFASTSHVVDVGGLGFGPDGRQVFEEGLYVPILKLLDRGEVNQTLIDMARANVREPEQLEGDFYSLAACNDIGGRRLLAMMDEFALDDLGPLADHIVETSHRAMVEEARKLPQGTWSHAMRIDGYEAPLDLVAELSIGEDGIDIDFGGTSGVSDFGINVPLSYTQAYATFGVRCVVGNTIPNNAGSLSAVRVTAPEGSILNAPPPRAVAARHAIGQMLPDVVLGCLAQAVDGIAPAEGTSCLWNFVLYGGAGIAGHSGGANATPFTMAASAPGPTRTACPPPPFPRACATRRWRSTRPSRRSSCTARSTARIPAVPGGGAAASARSWRSAMSRARRSPSRPCSTGSTMRRAAGSAVATVPAANRRWPRARSWRRKAGRSSPRAIPWCSTCRAAVATARLMRASRRALLPTFATAWSAPTRPCATMAWSWTRPARSMTRQRQQYETIGNCHHLFELRLQGHADQISGRLQHCLAGVLVR